MKKPPDKPRPPRRGRDLSADELELWWSVTRLADPLKGDFPPVKLVDKIKKSAEKKSPSQSVQKSKATRHGQFQERNMGDYSGVDRGTSRRFKQGKRPIEATLDLHGMSREGAHILLTQFITGNYHKGRRMLLVITGKGRSKREPGEDIPRDKRGVLQTALPHWLSEREMARYVLAYDVAQPKDGGPGAFYVLLRRHKE